MLKFISFGSGSSGNCYYLGTATDGLLIDIGVGIRTLKKHARDYGISLSTVRRILITHDHADHIKSVGAFCHDYNVPVYATEKVHSGIERNYCVQRKLPKEFKLFLEPGTSVRLGDFMVTPFLVPHDASENVGYKIEVDGLIFVIMTDAGSVTEEMKTKDRIISPNGHLSNKECGQVLAENMSEQLKHVWLCHLSEENNHPELARKTVDAILRSYGIIPGKDIQLEVLKRKMPSEVYELE